MALLGSRIAYADVEVQRIAPDAPDAVHNMAMVQIVGYLFDQPGAAANAGYANAVRNSGAGRMLLPWRVIGLGLDLPVDPGLPLGQFAEIARATVMVAAATWSATTLAIPSDPFLGVSYIRPDGIQTGIMIIPNDLTAEAPVQAGTPAGPFEWIFGQDAATGRLAVAFAEAGQYTVIVWRIG